MHTAAAVAEENFPSAKISVKVACFAKREDLDDTLLTTACHRSDRNANGNIG